MNCITKCHRQCYKTRRSKCTRSTLDISSYSMPPDTSVSIKNNLLKSLQSKIYTMLNMYVSEDRSWWTSLYYRKKSMVVLCLLWSSTTEQSYMNTTADAHAHTNTCMHTQRTIRSSTYTTRFLKPHKMSNTYINNSKQCTPKEAMAMHTPNASCESVMSLKPNCTLECTAGLKMAATHSLPTVKSAHIHFT